MEIGEIKALFNWAQKNSMIQANPILKVSPLPKNPVKKRRALKDKEVAMILSCSPDYLRPVIRTFLLTGMRKNELVSMQWDNVDFAKRLIHIPAAIAKNGESRDIPMNDSLMSLLKEQKKKSRGKYVFENNAGRPWVNNLLTRFKKAVKKAGIENPKEIDLHALRYSFGTTLYRRTKDIKAIQKLLGHKDVSITLQIYSQVFDEDVHAVVAQLPDY